MTKQTRRKPVTLKFSETRMDLASISIPQIQKGDFVEYEPKGLSGGIFSFLALEDFKNGRCLLADAYRVRADDGNLCLATIFSKNARLFHFDPSTREKQPDTYQHAQNVYKSRQGANI